MSKLPVLRPKELVRALKKLGFLVMVHEGKNKQITIPIHNKSLKRGTLAAILR